MARTNVSDVKTTIDTVLSDSEVSSFIDDANIIVEQNLTNEGMNQNELTVIEKYLACHLIGMKDKRVSQESVGDSSFTFEGESGLGLKATRYGQQALAMDQSGQLKKLSEGTKNTSFDAIGVDI